MVKKLILLSILAIFVYPAIAQDVIPVAVPEVVQVPTVVQEPKWEDFCEIGYEFAKVYDGNSFINIVSFVKAEQVKQTYWAKRRDNFETGLTLCRAVHDTDKASCYKDLVDREDRQNEIYSSRRKEYVYFKRPFVNSSRTF